MAAADRRAAPPVQLPSAAAGSRCSVLSQAAHESTYGTAPAATAWFALEQPGPWGHHAARESHLDRNLGGVLGESVKTVGGRFALIRRPGAHPDDHRRHRRRLLVAHCRPGAEWLVVATVTDPETLRAVDFAALGEGSLDGVVASLPGARLERLPQLLVCTNGRRDVCCAVRGRPVAEGVAATRPEQVWETTHTGGHRFAPTAVLLPSGFTFGRISPAGASEALTAAEKGEFPLVWSGPHHDRGRSALSRPAQAAESAVRHHTATAGLNSLRVAPRLPAAGSPTGATSWCVEHEDGRWWDVSVLPSTAGPARPVSCGRSAEAQHGFDVSIEAS
jgi:hypothetical protein